MQDMLAAMTDSSVSDNQDDLTSSTSGDSASSSSDSDKPVQKKRFVSLAEL